MSAIVGGTCRRCGEAFYVSFGHPDWYPIHQSGKRRELSEDEQKTFEHFNRMRKSEMCIQCYALENREILGTEVTEDDLRKADEMRRCLDCCECKLWPDRTRVVWGDGDENADVMFVFEAPGQHEDRVGHPMVDFAMTGAEYNHLIHRMGLNRQRVYTTNLVKCHPPDDRNPDPDEIEACMHHLYHEISVVRPKLIVAAGQFAIRFLLRNPDASVEMEHGFVNPGAYNDLDVVADVMPIYHPAAGLHDPIRMLWIQQDFDAVREAVLGRGKTKPVDDYAGRERYELVTDPREMEWWLAGNYRVSVDTEWARGGPWCMSLSVSPGEAKVVMVKDSDVVKVIAKYLANPQVTTLMHNALYDLRVLYKVGVEPGRILDTMVMAYLLHDHQALKILSSRHMGMSMKEYNDMTGWATRGNALAYLEAVQELGGPWPDPHEVLEFVKGQPKVRQPQNMARKLKGIMRDLSSKGEAVDPYKRWHNIPEEERACVEEQFGFMYRGDLTDIPIEDATYYSGRDADSTLRLFYLLRDKVEDQGLWPTLERDMRAMPMVLDMMENGIKPDPVKFAELSQKLGRRMDELVRDIEIETKVTINPGSPDQVANLLFKKLRLRRYKGMSTGDKVLARIAHLHPVVQCIRDWRTYQKLKTSYADVLPTKYLNKSTGRVHTSLRMTRVATGRLSSSNPNLMAQPVRTSEGRDIRNGFVVEDGYEFMSADYCLAKGTRILTYDLRWVPIETVKFGDMVWGIEEEQIKGRMRRMKLTMVTNTGSRIAYRYKMTVGGKEIVCSGDHPWLARRNRSIKIEGIRWVKTRDILPGMEILKFHDPWDDPTDWESGYLAGVFDGDGSISFGRGVILTFIQNPGPLLDDVYKRVTERGYDFHEPWNGKPGGYEGSGTASSIWISNRRDIARFLGTIRPQRLINKAWPMLEDRRPPTGEYGTVEAVEEIGKGIVYSLETTESTFVAEGYFTHNSQIEMRVPAMMGRDAAMIRIFRHNLDIHAETAAMMFGIPVGAVEEMKHRYPAKRVGFGILNDITAAGLLRELVVGGAPPDMWTVGDCDDMINAWFDVYKGIAKLMKDSREFAMRNGYVVDMWGRRRYVPGIRAKNERLREDALRQAGNGPIQMGAQGVIKQAMGDLVPVYRSLNRGELRPLIKPIIQIHDDLVNEILVEMKPIIIPAIVTVMEGVQVPIAPEWRVPLPVDPKTGVRWGTLKKERWGYNIEVEPEPEEEGLAREEEEPLYGDQDLELDEAV